MCSSIFESSTTTMDNYQGDLTDIIRATGTGAGAYSTITSSSSSEPLLQHHHDHNQWHPHHQHHQHHQPMSFSNSILEDNGSGSTNNINMSMNMNIFGDPLFSTLRDPFLQELDHIPSSSYFNIPTSSIIDVAASGVSVTTSSSSSLSASASVFALDQDHHQHHQHEMMRSGSRPCKNIFSNMIQISPNATKLSNYESSSSTMAPSPRQIKPVVAVSTNININAKDSLLDNSGSGTVQISSSRNNTGLKRRKNQAKKVVCIPAPAAANSRQTGEVVPSDLWAWRKYGQKPIKGSPYPRGYYRCSSSKGCSARKQVERSRTDPNMLVITYTSEHNHPWPTQRNALAGSTRSQPSKNSTSMKNSETSSQPQTDTTTTTTTKTKEEQHQESDGNGNDSPVVNSVKEESMEDIEKLQIEMDEGGEFNDALSYKPFLMENNQSHEDFFAELGEIEADPLNLLFNQGFGGNSSNDIIHQRDHQSKSLDAFHLFDWSGDNNNNNNSANNSFEEPNKRRRGRERKIISRVKKEKECWLVDWKQTKLSPTFVLEYWWMGQKAEEQKVAIVETSTFHYIQDMITRKLSSDDVE